MTPSLPSIHSLLPLLLLLGVAGVVRGEISTFFDPGEDRWLELYPGEELTGEPITLYWGHEHLNGSWGSIQLSGVWALYSEPFYMGDNVTVVFGEELQMNLQHPLGSARYIGNSRHKTFPALHLYALSWFRGREHVVEVGPDEDLVLIPNFRDFGTGAESLIAVGSDWTLFSGPNFFGPNCTCIQLTHFSMSSYDGDNEMMAATFHPYLSPEAVPSGDPYGPVGDLAPVGSAIMTCQAAQVPMKRWCNKLPWEKKHTARCPALSRGVDVCA